VPNARDDKRDDELDKQENGPLVPFEQWMGRTALPWIPAAVSANQLTLAAGISGALAGLAFYLASFHKAWFAVAALMVFLHWALDNIDGHVARSRKQTSKAGRFLDLFLDGVTFAVIGIGIGFASYAQLSIVAVGTILIVLQYLLTVLWMMLTQIWPFPAFGPAEGLLTLIVGALLMTLLPAELVTVWGMRLSLVDILYVATILFSSMSLVTSAFQLFRRLQREDAAAARTAAGAAQSPKPVR
jgi:phosphatidylglycerophosphate synthase